jgi:hypothetical protein
VLFSVEAVSSSHVIDMTQDRSGDDFPDAGVQRQWSKRGQGKSE